jgi:hypothetical protein
VEEGFFGLEVQVEGALRQPAGRGDVFDARVQNAVLTELGAGGGHQGASGVGVSRSGHEGGARDDAGGARDDAGAHS